MRRKKSSIVAAIAAVMSFGYGMAMAQSAEPLLGHMDAMHLVLDAVSPKYGRDVDVSALDFDKPSQAWLARIDREGETPRVLIVTVSETTGQVCVRDAAANSCLLEADASNQLDAARDKRTALDEAMRNPPPDLQGAMIALIRYQATTQGAYLNANPGYPLYVSMQAPNHGKPIDLSLESIGLLKDIEVDLFPGSAWVPPKENIGVGTTMTMGIGLPTRRADGDYDVQYGFWCGGRCASSHTAVLRRDALGWHVVSSSMDSIS